MKKSLLQWCIENNKENLIKEFDIHNKKSIETISYGSNSPVIWNGSCGHKFEMPPKTRIKGHNCPYCTGQKVLSGFNDLETWCIKNNSELLEEWDYKNNTILPNQIAPHSHKKVYWTCKHGHNWLMSPKERTYGTGCPYCANKKVLAGFNDFETWCKKHNRNDVLQEWDYTKNSFKPVEVIAASNTKIHWICEHGHKFQQTINDRKNGRNCPECSYYKQISFNEKAIAFYVEKHFNIIENYKANWLGNMSIDIYIPNLNIGIEYDGQYYHNNKKDKQKNIICHQNNVKLIRVREPKCETLNDGLSINITMLSLNDKHLEDAIHKLLKCLNINDTDDINIKKDTILILEKVKRYNFKNSLYSYCKNHNMQYILDEWDNEKNKNITPKTVTPMSKHNVFWICPHGHSYTASIGNRTKNGTGCPYCSGRKKILGINDLKTYCKTNSLNKIMKEWSPNNKKMESYPPFSNNKVEWICSNCGHVWMASIDKRIKMNRGCPKCARLRNGNLYTWCLENKKENLINEWCKENGTMTDYSVSSSKHVLWECSTCGHKWKTRIDGRTQRNNGCPICSKIKNKTPVVCMEKNKFYKSIKSASNDELISGSLISKCCRKGFKYTAGGYHWRYATEQEIKEQKVINV